MTPEKWNEWIKQIVHDGNEEAIILLSQLVSES